MYEVKEIEENKAQIIVCKRKRFGLFGKRKGLLNVIVINDEEQLREILSLLLKDNSRVQKIAKKMSHKGIYATSFFMSIISKLF